MPVRLSLGVACAPPRTFQTIPHKANVTQEKYFLPNEPAYSEVESQRIQVFSTNTLF